MKSTALLSAAAWIALLLVSATASATPVNYSESVSGDLPGFGSLTTFTFDIGTNVITGTFGSTPVNDFDSFAFVVPAGMQLIAGGVIDSDATGDILSTTWRVRSGSTTYDTGTFIEDLAANVPGSDLLANVPFGPGTYSVSHVGFSTSTPSTANYTFSFNVVPEPATFGLLAVGIIFIMLRVARQGT